MAKKIEKNKDKLRIVIVRTNKHFYIRLISHLDKGDSILMETSTLSQKLKLNKESLINISNHFAKSIKEIVAQTNKSVYFDRNGLKYQFNVKLVADSIRENGIIF